MTGKHKHSTGITKAIIHVYLLAGLSLNYINIFFVCFTSTIFNYQLERITENKILRTEFKKINLEKHNAKFLNMNLL